MPNSCYVISFIFFYFLVRVYSLVKFMVFFIVVLVIVVLVVRLVRVSGLLVSFRSFIDYEKSSPFECGFDPKNSARISFSLRFFLLAVIFVIFDIEIIFLFPIPFIVIGRIRESIVILGLFVFFVLFLGLLHEWHEGSLDWSK